MYLPFERLCLAENRQKRSVKNTLLDSISRYNFCPIFRFFIIQNDLIRFLNSELLNKSELKPVMYKTLSYRNFDFQRFVYQIQ